MHLGSGVLSASFSGVAAPTSLLFFGPLPLPSPFTPRFARRRRPIDCSVCQSLVPAARLRSERAEPFGALRAVSEKLPSGKRRKRQRAGSCVLHLCLSQSAERERSRNGNSSFFRFVQQFTPLCCLHLRTPLSPVAGQTCFGFWGKLKGFFGQRKEALAARCLCRLCLQAALKDGVILMRNVSAIHPR